MNVAAVKAQLPGRENEIVARVAKGRRVIAGCVRCRCRAARKRVMRAAGSVFDNAEQHAAHVGQDARGPCAGWPPIEP